MNGCKYPGTPEPCEGYREAMEMLKGVLEGSDQAHIWLNHPEQPEQTPISMIDETLSAIKHELGES